MHQHHRQPVPTDSDVRVGEAPPPERRWTYHFAAQYVDRGFSVIPLLPHSKVPAIGWKPYQSQFPTEADLRAWFSRDTHNIGIVTGRISSLIVVDADTPDDAAWCQNTFPRTPLAVITGRGGCHFYYQLPANAVIGNRARIFGRAIDIRGEGGVVCAPPSIHQNGNIYSWANFGDDYRLADVPVFETMWLPAANSEGELPSHDYEVRDVHSARTASRIRGLIRYLDKEVPDRSARDWSVVLRLRRLGCSLDEIANLVRGHSKFQDEAYLHLTLANAFKTQTTCTQND